MPGAQKAHIKECAQAEEDMKEQPLPESADDRLARVEQDVCEQRRMIKELVTAQREASAPLLRQWLPAWRAQALHLDPHPIHRGIPLLTSSRQVGRARSRPLF